MTGDVHSVFQKGKSHDKVEGRDGETRSTHVTQAGAMEAGGEAARAAERELVGHGTDGAIRERDSYGHDPASRPG